MFRGSGFSGLGVQGLGAIVMVLLLPTPPHGSQINIAEMLCPESESCLRLLKRMPCGGYRYLRSGPRSVLYTHKTNDAKQLCAEDAQLPANRRSKAFSPNP